MHTVNAPLDTTDKNPGAHILIVAAAAVVLIYGLKYAAPIMVPFSLAIFLALLSFPIVFWLHSKGLPSFVATLAAVLVNVAVVSIIILLIIFSVSDFQERMLGYVETFQGIAESTTLTLEDKGLATAGLTTMVDDLINPRVLVNIAQGTLGKIVDVLATGFLVFLIIIFALGEASSIPDKLRYILGKSEQDPGRFFKITREVFQYLIIKTVVSIATGICVGIGTWIIGLDFPVLWGLLAFALNYIPNIGSIIAAVPAILLALVQFGAGGIEVGPDTGWQDLLLQFGWGQAIATSLLYLFINVFFGNIVEPSLMGRRLGLSTLVVVLSLVFWGWVWGPIGMLLSVPLTMVLKIMLENTTDFRWLAILLSQWPMPAAETAADPELAAVESADIDEEQEKPESEPDKKN